MQAVIETSSYLSDVAAAALSEDEQSEIISFVAANPAAGVRISGTGGARKIRFAGRGKGKSGGYRVVTYFAATDVPVFLLAIITRASGQTCRRRNRTRCGKSCPRSLMTIAPGCNG
jgi:hypothetical protein